MIDLDKQRETVHNAINTLFDIAKVQKAEIDMLNVDIANKQAEIDSLKAQLARVESGDFVVVPKEPTEKMMHSALMTVIHNNGDVKAMYKVMIEAAQENSHE